MMNEVRLKTEIKRKTMRKNKKRPKRGSRAGAGAGKVAITSGVSAFASTDPTMGFHVSFLTRSLDGRLLRQLILPSLRFSPSTDKFIFLYRKKRRSTTLSLFLKTLPCPLSLQQTFPFFLSL
ncbi:hypothetical protein L1887_09776 [Cichorium endivia]|nr:hypothetical protein L1887_09776 [Cichorium endivia]